MSRLDYRRDHRTVTEFGKAIKAGTLREGRLIREWRERMLEQGTFSSIEIADNGMDNTGSLILDDELVNDKADFILTVEGGSLLPDGEHIVELKYSPCLWKATYKVGNLKAYIAQGASLLTVWGLGPEDPVRWALIGPDKMQAMLDFVEPSKNHPGMGGKPAVLINKDIYPAFFDQIYMWDGV
jgi:hypothetical protein